MRRVRINAGKVGLVYKNGDYKRVITEGKHWVGFNVHVYIYDLDKMFTPRTDFNILLKDEQLKSMLTVVDIKDNELVLVYNEGRFETVLRTGRYAYWNSLINYSFVRADLTKTEIDESIDKSIFISYNMLEFINKYTVESYEKGILYEDRKYVRMLEEGEYYFWKTTTNIEVIKTDMREQHIVISGQELLTNDKAALRLNFSAKYKVVDIKKALMNNKDYEAQLYAILQLAIREYVGKYSLDELLVQKESIASAILKHVSEKASSLGVIVSDAGIRDIILPGEVKEIMNQVLIAQKRAQANVITRREETASTRSLLNTAKLLEDNAMLYKLKEMEYVEKIADKINTISLSGGSKVVDQLKEIFTK